MKLQYVSDLHLEMRANSWKKTIITQKGCDVLILAGDITVGGSAEAMKTFISFLTHYSKLYDYILHVAGNHEYWNSSSSGTLSMDDINARFKQLESTFSNYRYMNMRTIIINNYAFIGATLWTYIPPENIKVVQQSMNDYVYIKKKNEKVTPKDINKIHTLHKKYICNQIQKHKDKKIILITHHKPVKDSNIYTPFYDPDTIVAYEVDMARHISDAGNVIIAIHVQVHMKC